MDRSTIFRGLALGIPSVILALLPLAFPALTLWLLGGLVGLWVIVLLLMQTERILSLQKQLREKGKSEPLESSSWTKIDEITLFLEGEQATRSFDLAFGDTIRVSVSGKHRFKVYLGKPRPRGKAERLEEVPETKSWTGQWTIKELGGGEYQVIVEPAGAAPFWVEVRIEKEKL